MVIDWEWQQIEWKLCLNGSRAQLLGSEIEKERDRLIATQNLHLFLNSGACVGVCVGVCGGATTGCFFNWYPPKKLKYVKPRLGESTLT